MLLTSLYTSTTGVQAASDLLDVTGNNVANSNTPESKAARTGFQDLLDNGPAAVPPSPEGVQAGLGARLDSVTGVFTQGSLTQTGAPLNLAVNGDGFFRVTRPGGTAVYTRDGTFTRPHWPRASSAW